jgi:hypothetical protein
MKFRIVKVKAGAYLGYVEAETCASARQKAKRIELSVKECAWRGEDWRVLEESTPFKSNPAQKKYARRKSRRCDVADEYTHRRLKTAGGYKTRARNGTVAYD